jgi:hypothetical protein
MSLEAFFCIGLFILIAVLAIGFTMVLYNQDTAVAIGRRIMATQVELDAAIATLKTDVETLIAAQKPVDLQPQVDAVNAIDAEVKAATPAP